MTDRSLSAANPHGFRTLLDTAEEVYFRYTLEPTRGFSYVSPSVALLTGHAAEAFYADPAICVSLVAREDRRLVGQVLRARRTLTLTIRLERGEYQVALEVRTVPVVRERRVVAVEGVARVAAQAPPATQAGATASEPTQARLAALMYEVHELLHRVLPPAQRKGEPERNAVTIGRLSFDLHRLVVTEDGRAVALTSRELMVLRYLLLHLGRVVTREQLLLDVWGHVYTGDDRTVDVHISRLRRKLPSLAGRLVAIKHLGYRIEADEDCAA